MDAFVGEIRPFAFGFVPTGWMACSGQLVNVFQYQVLYTVLGNMYGGTANVNFNLPNLQGQTALGAGSGPGLTARTVAQTGGVSTVSLALAQIPSHNHTFDGAIGAAGFRKAVPPDTTYYLTNFGFGATGATTFTSALGYTTTPQNTTLNPVALAVTGGAPSGVVAHENKQPYLTIEYCICFEGTYPMRNN